MYQKVKATELPKPEKRVRASKIEGSEEFEAMKADLANGLKPGEVLQLSFTSEDREKYGIKNWRTIPRTIERYIEANGIDAEVSTYKANGLDNVVIKPKKKSRSK